MNASRQDKPEQTAPDTGGGVRQLMEDHAGQLYALGLRFCGDPRDAEDLVQEVFLQALRSWDTFEGRSSAKTWLYTIASRVCGRMHRRRSGEPQRIESLEALLPFGDPKIAAIPDEQNDVVQGQIRREARERIEAAIAQLPEDFRMPLVLKEIVGFTVPEISAMLGLEEGTVKSRVHRARLRLRAAVDDAIPRADGEAGPPAYDRQTCLDLLNAKQEALDRGVPFDAAIICDRCRSVFASLDLTQQVCHDLSGGRLPEGLRQRLQTAIAGPSPS